MASVWPGPRSPRSALVVLVIVCASARLAAGQEGEDGSGAGDRRREASDHVKKGDAFKETGDYEAAAREYQKAYELVPHPVLFFNLGQAFRLNGDLGRALRYYERYLAADPNGQASKQARQFAAQLRLAIEESSAREGNRRRPVARPRSKRRARPVAAQSSGGAGRGLRIAGLVSAGAGLVAIGVGAKFGLDARRITSDINAHEEGEWPDDLLARQAEGERAERAMFILTGAGAAAIAAGGLLYYLGHSAGKGGERAVAVSPVATGEQIGVLVGGRF